METPKTLQEAIIYFSDRDNCHWFMVAVRWPDGKIACPHCKSEKVKYLEKARLWKCYQKHPKAKFSLKTGTVFEDSPIGLDKWLPVMWMLVNCKNGVSSWEIHRALGVTQKTAWFMLHRGRLAMQDVTNGKLGGKVEADETFIGGKARNMHAKKRRQKIHGRGSVGKAVVLGMLERRGEVKAVVVKDRKKKTLQPRIQAVVEKGSELHTDDLKSYEGLDDYIHKVIDHAVAYVDGTVHTNGMENFWSLLKRGLHGTYVSVEPFHLFRYLDEQTFRYNNRRVTDSGRFCIAMSRIIGKRLTYQELIGGLESGARAN